MQLRLSLVAAALILLATVPARAGAPRQPKLTDAERAQLEHGDAIVLARAGKGDGVTEARAITLVDAAPKAVWAIIEACGRYSEFMPRVAESREVARDGRKVECYLKLSMPFPISDLWSQTMGLHEELGADTYRRRWKLKDGTYRVNEGSWVIWPWGAGGAKSLVVYTLRVAPKAAVPEAFVREGQREALPDMMKALQERVKRPN